MPKKQMGKTLLFSYGFSHTQANNANKIARKDTLQNSKGGLPLTKQYLKTKFTLQRFLLLDRGHIWLVIE